MGTAKRGHCGTGGHPIGWRQFDRGHRVRGSIVSLLSRTELHSPPPSPLPPPTYRPEASAKHNSVCTHPLYHSVTLHCHSVLVLPLCCRSTLYTASLYAISWGSRAPPVTPAGQGTQTKHKGDEGGVWHKGSV